ncbi:sigma-70 family RNA polymerase sigma factor [Thermodesulfobacterium hydrogeniphilum]|uniref:sigma-70 family RNA polymerase sigma factor n=1 Tax=Thermodesulfobacterium hydrogeniphilum TaxID=161156 RepID=UPI00068944B3|nr:sigma-70 family RNA polymerase sigma factor [Thermodesulfobacterium hydrogeniphilum]
MSLQSKKNFCLFDEEEMVLEEVSENDDWVEEDVGSLKKKKSADPIKIYFKEVFSHKLLTKEDEVRIGQTIEKNEKIILNEILNFYSSTAKFYHLLIQSERRKKLALLFKDWEELEKDENKSKEWLEKLKQILAESLDNSNNKYNLKLKAKAIDLIYEVRPTKILLDELACEILETYEKIKNFNNLKLKIQKKYLLDEKDLDNIFSLNGSFSKIEKYAQNFSITKSDLEKIKRSLFEYKKFLKRFNEFFGEPLEEVYNSGEKIYQAFQEIKKCKEELVKSNLRLIISLARKYSPKGMFLADLIQEGNIGLLKAIEKFDYRKGFKFSTYATWWIRQSITRYLAENTRTIRIPLHIIETIYKISKVISTKFYQEYGRDPTLDELAKETGLSIEKLNYVFKVMKQPVSLETTVGDEEDTTLRDFIEDQNAVKPDEAAFNMALSEKIRELLKTLSPREEKIIRLRFGIGEKESCTLEEVCNKFGVTKERIRQIESIALRKLKHPNRIKLLKNFLIYGS